MAEKVVECGQHGPGLSGEFSARFSDCMCAGLWGTCDCVPDGGGEKEGKEEGEVRKSGEDGDEDDEPEVEEDLENDDYAAGEFFFAVNLVFRRLTSGIFSCLALERRVVFWPRGAVSCPYICVRDDELTDPQNCLCVVHCSLP